MATVIEDRARIRVLLADDHQMVREGLRRILEPHCEIVGEASTGEEAIELAGSTRPSVIVLDIGMPGMGGLAAARMLASAAPSARVIMLSQYSDAEYVLEALGEAKAAGYLVKADAAADLLTAVRAVAAGKRYLSPAVAPIVLDRLNNPNPNPA